MGNCNGSAQNASENFEDVVTFTPEGDLATALSEAQRLLAAQDFHAAAPFVRAAAKMGHAEAQTLLGLMYDQGIGFDSPQPDLAVYWWQKAAAQSARLNQQQKLAALTYKAQSSIDSATGSTLSSSSTATDPVAGEASDSTASGRMVRSESLMLAAAAGDSTSVAILALSRAQIPQQRTDSHNMHDGLRSSGTGVHTVMSRSLSP